MKTTLLQTLWFLTGLAALSCNDYGTNTPVSVPHPMPPLTSAQSAVVSSGNTFGFNLFRDLDKIAVGQNLMVSPLSVSMALGMTLNGAAGTTRDAMEQTLGFTGMGSEQINATYAMLMNGLMNLDPTVTMEIGNSIWYRPALEVEQTFKDVNTAFFNAQIRSINFSDPSAPGVINGWVSDATHGKIPSIVPDPIPHDIVMYLINAVYFKASWTQRFDSGATKDGVFSLSNGSTVPCRMMVATDSAWYFTEGGVEGVDLPYGGAGFSMTVLLPPVGTDIDQFVADLSTEKWEHWMGLLTAKRVEIHMPKYRLQYFVVLNKSLGDLGMGIAFTDGANFTGIDRRGNLAISEVLHKTFIQVDEEGTEAAAVTSVGMRATSVGPGGIPVVVLNRPYVYVIREHASGTILFIGKLAEPQWMTD